MIELTILVLAIGVIMVLNRRQKAFKASMSQQLIALENEMNAQASIIKRMRERELERQTIVNKRLPHHIQYKCNYRVDWFPEGKKTRFSLSFVFVYADDAIEAQKFSMRIITSHLLAERSIKHITILEIEEA